MIDTAAALRELGLTPVEESPVAPESVKIGWRNWGRQLRVLPMPNLMSPAYRQACHKEMARYSRTHPCLGCEFYHRVLFEEEENARFTFTSTPTHV